MSRGHGLARKPPPWPRAFAPRRALRRDGPRARSNSALGKASCAPETCRSRVPALKALFDALPSSKSGPVSYKAPAAGTAGKSPASPPITGVRDLVLERSERFSFASLPFGRPRLRAAPRPKASKRDVKTSTFIKPLSSVPRACWKRRFGVSPRFYQNLSVRLAMAPVPKTCPRFGAAGGCFRIRSWAAVVAAN